jgi:hypothetical protein
MRLRLGVAGTACLGSTFEHFSPTSGSLGSQEGLSLLPCRPAVTVTAAHLGVLAIQGELAAGMVELQHAIHTVVAGQACLTEILLVLFHEVGIFSDMTVLAGLECYPEAIARGMADLAVHHPRLVVQGMVNELKVGPLVFEFLAGQQAGVEISTLMVRVTGRALPGRGNAAVRAIS